MAGVGAAFDFIAGTAKQAPAWMQENGLEWFFRLTHEPRRLWRRYLVDGIKVRVERLFGAAWAEKFTNDSRTGSESGQAEPNVDSWRFDVGKQS